MLCYAPSAMNAHLLVEAIAEASLGTLFTALLLGALFGLVTGLWLLCAPASFFRLTAGWNRWFSLRPWLRFLEVPRYWESVFYRNHRLSGTLLLLAAGGVFAYFWILYDRARVLRQLDLTSGGVWALDGAVFLLRGASLVIAAVGLLVLLRPSLLKTPESHANRWVSTRRWLRPLEINRPLTDRLAQRRPRLAGFIITALSLYALVGLTLMALHWLGKA